MPVYIPLIDLTNAFDLVSRDGLFKVLHKIGCPPKLQSMIESFHTYTKGTVQFNGSSSKPFEIRSGVKQGCVLAPTVFGIFFGLFPKHAFDTTTEGIYLHTRSDGRLFNIARSRAMPKVCRVLIRDMLFANDAAVATHTQEELKSLMHCFLQACKDFGLTISLKKTNVLGQDTEAPPDITIDDYELDVVCQFTYLGSTMTDNLSLDAQIDKRIGKAASTLASLISLQCLCFQHIAVWQRDMDYACLAGEKDQHIPPEKHPPYHVTNTDVLSRTGLPSMYTLLRNAECDGWIMPAIWRMVAFQNTSSTVSWLWGGEPPAALTCDINMSA